MPEEIKFRVRLPNGQMTKPYSKAKITAAVEGGKLPLDAQVESPERDRVMPIQEFCFGARPSPSPAAAPSQASNQEQTLYKASPSMFRNAPIHFVICLLLILAWGIGLLIFLIWFLRCWSNQLIVTNKRVTHRRGILAKATNEVWHRDIRNVRVHQSFLQRIFGVGHVGIASAGHGDIEIQLGGLPRPNKIKEIIDQHRG